jgi:cytidylate kinase
VIIAIDGPAGTGKSTIAQMLAEGLTGKDGRPFTYINSGNLYRAITLGCLRGGIDPRDKEKTLEYAKEAPLVYRDGRLYLGDEAVEPLLHSDEIDRHVSPLSAITAVRHVVNDHLRRIAAGREDANAGRAGAEDAGLNAVVEGRDMTTVVFPHAEYRFYLDASVRERARRRFEQGVSRLSLEEIEKAIADRDELDRNKEEGSLVVGEGVVYLDTSHLTLKQVYDRLRETIH